MHTEAEKTIEILLVEDSPADVELIREALAESNIRSELHVTSDGMDAMKFLRREDSFSRVPCPDLVLLDLNLPKMDGREVLREIKEDAKLRLIPVVILTGSREEQDIAGSYNLHANCYVMKPSDPEEFMRVVNTIEDFWSAVAKRPCR